MADVSRLACSSRYTEPSEASGEAGGTEASLRVGAPEASHPPLPQKRTLRDSRHVAALRGRMFRSTKCALVLAALSVGGATGCVGTTGGELVDFEAGAAGPRDAVAGEPLAFTTDRGFDVALTRATLHVGAMYLDQAFPVSGAQSTSCILPGTYVAEVTRGVDVDLLDPDPTAFPGGGQGTTLPARAGQVWLTHGDVNAAVDPSDEPILDFAGTSTVGGEERDFTGTVTISSNRQTASELAGAESHLQAAHRLAHPHGRLGADRWRDAASHRIRDCCSSTSTSRPSPP